jgi:3-phosphoshikimate 1-carboxyvinyltransferase
MEIKNFLFSLSGKINVKKVKVSVKSYNESSNIWIPGSKSFTNRAVVLAGMSNNSVTLHGFLFSEDSYWGLNALSKLGFQIEINYVLKKVKITPPNRNFVSKQNIFFGKAGTLARFFPAVILNWQKTFPNSNSLSTSVNGESQLIRRPLLPLVTALKELGANISNESLPMEIVSSNLEGTCFISGEVSGQFLSGLLLSACGSKNDIKINRTHNLVQPDYVRMTIDSIHAFGGYVSCDAKLNKFEIKASSKKLGIENFTIEADASTCCYFIVLAFLHNFNLRIKNLGSTTLQPDFKFIHILIQMGAKIELSKTETFVYKRDINIKPKGNFSFDFSLFSDQALTIGAVGLFADAPIEISGVSHIRHHESDRISCFVKNILSLDLKIEEKPDGFIIFPIHKSVNDIYGEFETWDDHRFAMTGFLIASMLNKVVIKNPKCVEKTAPQFFTQVKELGFHIEIIEE